MVCASATYRPSDRIAALRERAMARPAELMFGARREYHYVEGWMRAEGQPLPMRNAEALANVIERMPVVLHPGELLVGEHGNDWDLSNFRPLAGDGYADRVRASCLSDEEKEQLVEWAARRPFEWQRLSPVAPAPEELRLAQERGVVAVWGTDLNHSIRGYEKVLRLGFEGLAAEVQTALDTLPIAEPDAAARRATLLGLRRVCEAAATLGRRHAAAARARAEAADGAERDEWLAVAEACEQAPAGPARTFREALQALWFAHMITVWEDGVNANGIGRIDQFLWPYLERDLAQGVLTQDEAAELLAALWVKLYQPYDVQQMMVGGQTPDGRDAVNPLSYLVLDVTEGLKFVRCLSARLHNGSPREFVSRCVDLVARGGGIPFFFNDEALVPAIAAQGIPVEEARGYAAIGCIEITIPGKASPHAVSNWINVAKCLELALNDGKDLLTGQQLGPKTGTLAEFESMDAVRRAYEAQVRTFADWAVYGSNAAEVDHKSRYRLPYLSLLTDDCVARGMDIIEGGARFNYHSSAAMGVPNVADCLAAIDAAVFRDRAVTGAELLEALRTDFAGNEPLRLRLRNKVPKYGNDDPLPDGYAADAARHYCETLGQYRAPAGGRFHVHFFTFTLMLPYGRLTGASADGRHAGEPLAYSLSPVQGRDREGLTAVVNSLSRIPHHLAAASSSAILEADPVLLEGAGKEAFVDLLIAAIRQGVGQLQFNVVSEEMLRAAQEDPERYRSLCVRVSGFSQQFCLLDREMQNHIISRVKHRR